MTDNMLARIHIVILQRQKETKKQIIENMTKTMSPQVPALLCYVNNLSNQCYSSPSLTSCISCKKESKLWYFPGCHWDYNLLSEIDRKCVLQQGKTQFKIPFKKKRLSFCYCMAAWFESEFPSEWSVLECGASELWCLMNCSVVM